MTTSAQHTPTPRVPQWRSDTKGNLRALLDECTAMMRGEIEHADVFIMQWDDCEIAVREYAPYLTDAELARCFRAALAKVAP